jgi:hypothetical protein
VLTSSHPTFGELTAIEALIARRQAAVDLSGVRVPPPDDNHRTRRPERSQMVRDDLIREARSEKDQVRCPDLFP